MNAQMKAGIAKFLNRAEMKAVLGGIDSTLDEAEAASCSKSNCQLQADGTRKKCPTGCSCDSSEARPCYKP
jgi:hypothetical protein